MERKRRESTLFKTSRRVYPLCSLLPISEKTSPILYSKVFEFSASVLKVLRYGMSFKFTNSKRSSPVKAFTISCEPSAFFGTAHVSQVNSSENNGLYSLPLSVASSMRSFSKSERYFKKRIQEVCSI